MERRIEREVVEMKGKKQRYQIVICESVNDLVWSSNLLASRTIYTLKKDFHRTLSIYQYLTLEF